MYALRPSIESLQHSLVTSFEGLKSDPQLSLDYLIDLGKALPSFPVAYRVEDNRVVGCLSRVWIQHRYREGILFLEGDSESMITKGLLGVLIHLFSGQPVEDILGADLSFLSQMRLPQLLGTQRRMGLESMLRVIRGYAQRYEQGG